MTQQPDITRKVWVLDLHGYDARGGNAEVFSTAEKAKVSVDWIDWEKHELDKYNRFRWIQKPSHPGSTEDQWVVYEVELDSPSGE